MMDTKSTYPMGSFLKNAEEKKPETAKDNEKLAQHYSELRQFLYIVSHDIKGPIANLKGLLDLIELEGMSSENAELIGKLNKTVSALNWSIKDLAHIIDIQNNMTQIYQRISLQEEIDQIYALLRTQIDDSGMSIKVDFDKLNSIHSVRPLLRSILSNLIANAIKYKSTTQKPTIKIWAEQTEGEICIHVKDNGLGIDLPQHRGKLFGLYNRFSDISIEGRGVGLFLVKLQVDTLKGSIKVNSKIGTGTHFSISLPLPKRVEKQLLVENDAGALYFDARLNCLKTVWKKSLSLKHVEEIFQKISVIAQIYETAIWIFNLDCSISPYLQFLDVHKAGRLSRYFSANSPMKQLILLKPEQSDDETDPQRLKKDFENAFNMDVCCMKSKEHAKAYIKNKFAVKSV